MDVERKKTYKLTDVLSALGGIEYRVVGDPNVEIESPASFGDAGTRQLTFYRKQGPEAGAELMKTKASVVLCRDVGAQPPAETTLILVEDPRKAFVRAISKLFEPGRPVGIHASATIDPSAEIHPTAYVGPGAVIGRCVIGAETVIHPHVILYGDVRIGNRVTIHAGTVIGSDGFGYERGEDGTMEKFLHLGGVSIADEVEIGSNTSIDRGTLGDTIIRRGVKIDNQVHIAHNCDVGEDAVIIAESMIGGSVKIGARAWIAPSAVLMNGIRVGEGAVCGLGCIVTKDVADGETVLGNPARPIAEAKALLAAQKRMLREQ